MAGISLQINHLAQRSTHAVPPLTSSDRPSSMAIYYYEQPHWRQQFSVKYPAASSLLVSLRPSHRMREPRNSNGISEYWSDARISVTPSSAVTLQMWCARTSCRRLQSAVLMITVIMLLLVMMATTMMAVTTKKMVPTTFRSILFSVNLQWLSCLRRKVWRQRLTLL